MVEEALRWLGYGLCHQLPERSFVGGVVQVPVCARDTGIYLGFVVGALALWLAQRGQRPSELPPPGVMALMVGFIGLMAIDGVTSYAGLRATTNEIRLVTGLMTGMALSALVVPLLNGQLWRRFGSGRVMARRRELGVFLVALPIAYAVTMWVLPLLGPLYPLLVAAAILSTFTAVNMVVVCLLPAFERVADRVRDVWKPAAIALAVTLVELAVAGAFKVWLLRLVGAA